jgi:ComF family protein
MNFLDLVFPKTCLECGSAGSYICAGCIAKVKLAIQICPYCGRAAIDGITHVKCRKKYGLDGLISVWEYEGVIRKGVLSLKYKYSTEAGKELTNFFIRELMFGDNLISGSVLVPIPLYWHRENTRGFNQSNEVGTAVAANRGWKFLPDLLVRNKSTVPQASLSGDKRRQNLKGVFAINSEFIVPDTVILFDDVFTTGSTLKEAAKILKKAGVEKVWGLTIAR